MCLAKDHCKRSPHHSLLVRLYRTIARYDKYMLILKKAGSYFVVLRVIKYEVFPDKPWLLQTKEGNGNETNWQYHRLEFREKGHGYYKAVQCLATSDDTASRLYIKFR